MALSVQLIMLLSKTFPEELRGTAFGVRMTGVRMGFTIGPVIAGYLYGGWSSSAPSKRSRFSPYWGFPSPSRFRGAGITATVRGFGKAYPLSPPISPGRDGGSGEGL